MNTEPDYAHVAIMHDTEEVVGVGKDIRDCTNDANQNLNFQINPGETAPYFLTTKRLRERFCGWFPVGFWDKWRERHPQR